MSIFRKVELNEETNEPIVEEKIIQNPVVDQSIEFNSKINENLIKIIENIVEKYLNKKLKNETKHITSKPNPIKPKIKQTKPKIKPIIPKSKRIKPIKPIKFDTKPWYFPK